jgi:hypothetical protein
MFGLSWADATDPNRLSSNIETIDLAKDIRNTFKIWLGNYTLKSPNNEHPYVGFWPEFDIQAQLEKSALKLY